MADILTLQFVDGPSATATLRYDFNVKNASFYAHPLASGGLDLGAPEWSGEPEGVGGVYGYRQMRFTQRVEGTKAVAMARMSALAKEMQRPLNWLKVQFAGSLAPVYYKIYRGDAGALNLEYVEASQAWDITVPLVADPLGYGPRVAIPTAQIIQAPADLAGPVRTAMRLVLPAIKGDAPTPLRVTLSPASPSNNVRSPGWSWLVACVAGSTSMTDTVVDIGTGDTVANASGTAAPTVDATYFGGSYRRVTVPATSPNLDIRFTINLPNTIQLGRYKVLLRAKPTAANKTFVFRAFPLPNGQGGLVTGATASVLFAAADTSRPLWVDVGDISVPFGLAPPSDAGGSAPAPVLAIQIGTADGSTATVDVDSIKLIPTYGPTVTQATLLKSRAAAALAANFVMTAPNETFEGDPGLYWAKDASSVYVEAASSALSGSFPVADPAAAQNLLLVMALDSGTPSATGTGWITTLNAQVAVDVSYYPRYLHVGDGT